MNRALRLGRATILAAVALLGAGCSSAASPASAPTATLDPAAPRFPPVTQVQLHPATPAQCTGPRTASISADVFDPVVDVAHLARRVRAVALVVAEAQQARWVPNAPMQGGDPIGATPRTLTDFKVLKTYKGTLPAWIQGDQEGALPGSLSQCDGAGYELINDATPRVGTEYVLFLMLDEGGGTWGPTGQYTRLEVRGQRVYSGQYQQPSGLSWTDVNGLSLQEVASQITG